MLEFDQQERVCHTVWFDADDSLRGRLRQFLPWI